MKKFTPFTPFLLLALAVFLVPDTSLGQLFASSDYASEGRQPQSKARFKSLQRVLSEIAYQYKVRFNYDPDLIKAKVVNMNGVKITPSNLEPMLIQLLQQLKLNVEKIKGNDYIIYPQKAVVNQLENNVLDNTLTEAPLPSQALEMVRTLPVAPFRSAQEITMTGKVTSLDKGEALPGVSVIIKGTMQGISTDSEGKYTIKVPDEKAILIFSFIGYLSEEKPISNRTTLDVALAPDIKALSEVVVVGYGTQKRTNVTGSVAQVTAKDIEERPINRIENALAGKMPGVEVRTTTGEPGAELQIRVRGTGSINASNEPLYVIDGIPVENLQGINPADVQSIEVLKDASSAAIYGSRGGNGVVIVTTKRGIKGKNKIQFSGRTGWQMLENKVDVMSAQQWIDQRKEGIDEAWIARGVQQKKDYKASDPMDFRRKELAITEPAQTNTTYIYDPRWETGQGLAYIDWQDELFRVAPIQDYQLSLGGGTEEITYNLSGGYLNQDGIALGTGFERVNLRANLDAKVGKRIKLGLTLAPNVSWQNGGRVDGKDQQAGNALGATPVAEADAGINTGTKPYRLYAWGGNTVSPVAVMQQSTFRTQRERLNASLYLHLDLVKGLQLQVTGAMDNNTSLEQQYYPTGIDRSWSTAQDGALSRSRRSTNRANRYMFLSTLNYNATLGDHTISALAGYQVEQYTSDFTEQENSKFANDWSYLFDFTSSQVNRSRITSGKGALLSYFGRVQYNFKEKYLLSASLRTDGSHKFGSQNQWGVFPAVSVGWRVGSESFMKAISWINELKLRASWGITGNNTIPDNAQYELINPANYSFNNTQVPGASISSLDNPNLGWETTSSYNVGFDFGILNNRIFLSADLYSRLTYDLLMKAPVSATTGFGDMWRNIGKVRNQGVELMLNTQNLVGNFHWHTTFNVSYNQNKVLQLGYDNTPIPQGFGSLTQIIQVNQPISVFMLYDVVGVYKDQAEVDASPRMTNTRPGDSKYRDVDNNGVIDNNDRTILGKPQPDYIFGMTHTFSYKKFDLSILLNAQTGGMTYAILGRALDKPAIGYLYNKMGRWANRWRAPDSPGDGMTPSLSATTGGYYDSRWLYKSDYFRIKNITLGYNLPNTKFYTRARLYVSLENAYIWHNYYGGYTPEASNNEGGDFGGYPQARTYSVGFNLTF